MSITTYLRCERDHPNGVPMTERHDRVGKPCSMCGAPLLAQPERERGPPRRY